MDLKNELKDLISNGMVVRLDFPELSLEKFSSIVLMLVNTKSNRQEGLVDFRTYTESNIIDMYFNLEDISEEKVLDFADYICKTNTLDETYTIETLGKLKIVAITNWLLEENKIIDEDEDFLVIKG